MELSGRCRRGIPRGSTRVAVEGLDGFVGIKWVEGIPAGLFTKVVDAERIRFSRRSDAVQGGEGKRRRFEMFDGAVGRGGEAGESSPRAS
jgi:hypothetical protein